MKPGRALRLVVVAGATALALGSVQALRAVAAPTARVVVSHAHYHLTYRHPGTMILDIAPAGRSAAWAFGVHVNAQGNPVGALLLRYAHGRWTNVPFPDQRAINPESITALAADEVWLDGSTSAAGEVLLHYRHGRWASLPLPPNYLGPAQVPVLVLADNDIWEGGGPQPPGCVSYQYGPSCIPISHWNGKQWRTYRAPVSNVTSIDGTSASDIWAAGDDGIANARNPSLMQPYVLRWTGSKFKRTSLSARWTNYVPLLTVLSQRNVWLGGTTPRHSRPGDCISHWNGRSWTSFSTDQSGYTYCDGLTSDGRNGVWVVPEAHWTGSEWVLYDPLPLRPIQPGTNQGVGEGISPIPRVAAQWVYGYAQQIRHGSYLIIGFIDQRR